MARTRSQGNGRLEETAANLNQSMAMLNQAMAPFLARMAEGDARFARIEADLAATNRRMNETNRVNFERFARIEAILMEHSRILRALPDAIRDKIGFKSTGIAKARVTLALFSQLHIARTYFPAWEYSPIIRHFPYFLPNRYRRQNR